jgi:hypothetical protein
MGYSDGRRPRLPRDALGPIPKGTGTAERSCGPQRNPGAAPGEKVP